MRATPAGIRIEKIQSEPLLLAMPDHHPLANLDVVPAGTLKISRSRPAPAPDFSRRPPRWSSTRRWPSAASGRSRSRSAGHAAFSALAIAISAA
jgi:hypothetical protein